MTVSPSTAQAIAAALSCDWKEAIRINTAQIKKNPQDTDAWCRLGFANLKIGLFTQAKKAFVKVIALDPYNQIAQKNLKKLTIIKRKDLDKTHKPQMSPMMFLEEPGKTKIAQCVNLAPYPILSALTAGQEVFLKPKNHCVEVRTDKQVYLAALPDDLSFKLIKLIGAGNKYQTYVKGLGKNTFAVLIREIYRGKRFAHQPSFISTTSYVPFSKPESASAAGPDMTPTGEEGEEDTKPVPE